MGIIATLMIFLFTQTRVVIDGQIYFYRQSIPACGPVKCTPTNLEAAQLMRDFSQTQYTCGCSLESPSFHRFTRRIFTRCRNPPPTILYCIAQLQGGGKYWRKVYLERMVGKYFANLHLNKNNMRLYNYYCSKAPKNSVLEAFSSKSYFTKLLHVCNQMCSSEYA